MSTRSAAVKRLMKEYADLQASPAPDFRAAPLETDVFEWHFTVRGPPEGGFLGGRYHGRIMFPADYPFKPPSIIFLTPSGRFETNKKICLSITDYHPEYWRPSWGVRSALTALQSFFLTKGDGAIGALDVEERERERLARRSREWVCDVCGGGGLSDGLADTGGERVAKENDGDDDDAAGKIIFGAVTGSTESLTDPSSSPAPPPTDTDTETPDTEGLRHRRPIVPDQPQPQPQPVVAVEEDNQRRQQQQQSPQERSIERRKKQIDAVILIIFLVISWIVLRRVGIVYSHLQ